MNLRSSRSVFILGKVAAGSGLVLLLTYVILQHWQVFPYHDDWGYATLSYVTEHPAGIGQSFTLYDLFIFLGNEYLNWTGRVLAFFIQINLFHIGLDAVRLVQCFIIMAIVMLTARVIDDGAKSGLDVLWPVLCFFSLPMFVLAGGLYWFSASIAYVWGILPLFLAAYRLKKIGQLDLLSSASIAVAALFQEQMAIASVAFLVAFIIISRCQQRQQAFRAMLGYSAPILIAAISVVMSPGNFARNAVSKNDGSMFQVIVSNISTLNDFIVGREDGHLMFTLLLLVLLVQACLFLSRIATDTYANGLILLAMLLMAVLYMIAPLVAFFIILLLIVFVSMINAVAGKVPAVVACCVVAAVASLVLLLLAPGVSGRSLLPFYFILFVPISYGLKCIALYCSGKIFHILMLMFLVVVMAWQSGGKAIEIYEGYSKNKPINIENNKRLLSAASIFSDTDAEEILPIVLLLRLENERYAETMPYQRPLVAHWMKRFYALPEKTVFIWMVPSIRYN